jgi:4-coumarate--CoA ligase
LNNSIGYGLTETSPNTHLLPEVDSIHKVGSIGFLLPNLEARLLVDGDGNGDIDAAEGEAGELWLRGPNIMKVCFLFPPLHNPILYP